MSKTLTIFIGLWAGQLQQLADKLKDGRGKPETFFEVFSELKDIACCMQNVADAGKDE